MARFEFTMVSDAMLQGLAEADATGAEMRAYIMLVRGLPRDRSTAECWMPADMAEKKIGMRPDVFSRSLRDLCKKTVRASDGNPLPVLTKITRGCRGHCPHYEDTLGLAIANGDYPPAIARQKRTPKKEPNGLPDGRPIEEPNGRQKQDPLGEFSTSEWKAENDQLEGRKRPIGRQSRHPIKTIQDKQLVADALLPTAEQSIGVSQPHKRNSNPPRVVTGNASGRAAGAAMERPAALPSREEYERIARKLETEGLDAITPDEREAYHQGHAAYAAD